MAALNPDLTLTAGIGGMLLARRGEMMPPGQFLYLRNVRTNTPTTLQCRNGYSPLNATVLSQLNIHTIRKLNDYISSSVNYIAGAGTEVQRVVSGGGGTTLLTGFSGDPLTMVSAQPVQSAVPWLYIGDRTRMGKVGVVGGTVVGHNMGIAQPNTPAAVTLGGTPYKVIDDFEATTGWSATTGTITNPDRVNTTITAILYDSGTTGYASIIPASFTHDIQPGMLLDIDSVTCLVHSVYPAVANTTIASIKYDSGTTGPCSIVLTTPSNVLKQDAVVRLDSGGAADEYVRVLAVSRSVAGQTSIRCSTVNTQVATNTITGVDSFRASLTNTAVATDTILSKAVKVAIGAASLENIDKTISVDLSNIGTRAVTDKDDMHISLQVSNSSLINEIQLRLDVDRSTNDFTRNYFMYTIRPNDLLPTTNQTLSNISTQQRAIQREQIEEYYRNNAGDYYQPQTSYDQYYDSGYPNDYYDPSYYRDPILDLPDVEIEPTQTVTGDSQWTEIKIKFSDLLRVGADSSVTLKDVKKVRVSVDATAAVDVYLDSWWIGGSYGPDAAPSGFGYYYFYAYRGRAVGGAMSNPSPVPRATILPYREAVTITGPRSSDPQVDTVEIYRQGGTLSTIQFVGNVANPGSGDWTFVDTLGDEEIVQNEQLQLDNFQPFPLADVPRSGTLDVVGTSITWASGDTFNTSWANGSIIIINGKATRLYGSPSSTTRAEITENLGSQTGVTFELPNALLLGQPLPVLVGPYTGGEAEYIFGLGDDTGNLYWTKAGQPDSAPDKNYVTVTSPSEPLIAGVMYDGRVYLWSTERMFFVQPDGLGGFVAQEVANGRGCLHSWSVCVNQLIYFIGKEGIYESEGGQPRLISGPLYDIFPNETSGAATPRSVDFLPILYTQPVFQRLATYGNYVYFCYQNTASGRRVLVWDIRRGIWISDDIYTHTPVILYGEEGRDIHGLVMGSTNGFIYQMGASDTDDGSDIPMLLKSGIKHSEWWRHFRSFRFAHASDAQTLVDIEVDGVFRTYPFASSSGAYINPYQPTYCLKGKSVELTIRAQQGFILFAKDCALEQKAWPNDSGYSYFNPFA